MRFRVACLVLAFLVAARPALAGSAKGLGRSLGREMESKLGSKSKVKSRLFSPMLSATPMKTMDGSQSFSAQLLCPYKTRILTLTKLGGGDFRIVGTLKLDSGTIGIDIDGVSGVCANGFVRCDPGTWSNCRAYKWEFQGGTLIEKEYDDIKLAELGGCYCTNVTCGDLASDLSLTSQILSHLGGGIIGAVQEANPRLVVSDTSYDALSQTLTWYGQDTKKCSSLRGTEEVDNLEDYRGSGDLPTDDVVFRQASDPNSYYSQLTSAFQQSGRMVELRKCEIKRTPYLDQDSRLVGYNLVFKVGWDKIGETHECFWATSSNKCRDAWDKDYDGNWEGCRQLNLRHLSQITSALVSTGDCIPYTDPVSGGTGCFTPEGDIDVVSYQFVDYRKDWSFKCYGAGDDGEHDPREAWHIYAFIADPTDYELYPQGILLWGVKDIPAVALSDTCGDIASQEGCRLKEEQVCDTNGVCVYTVRNFNPTGARVLPSCLRVNSAYTSKTYTFCADGSSVVATGLSSGPVTVETGSQVWWEIKRVYQCEAEEGTSIQTSRMDTVLGSVSPETGEYTDTVKSGYVDLSNVLESGECTQICVVRRPRTDTTEYSDATHRANSTTSTQTYDYIARTCVDGECPLDEGETLYEGCHCVKDSRAGFNNAVSSIAAVDAASHDIICSSEPPD